MSMGERVYGVKTTSSDWDDGFAFFDPKTPEKNIAKGPLEEEIPFGNNHFQVLC